MNQEEKELDKRFNDNLNNAMETINEENKMRMNQSAENLLEEAKKGLESINEQRTLLQQKLHEGRNHYQILVDDYIRKNIELDNIAIIHRATLSALPQVDQFNKSITSKAILAS